MDDRGARLLTNGGDSPIDFGAVCPHCGRRLVLIRGWRPDMVTTDSRVICSRDNWSTTNLRPLDAE